jgi:predicted permease
MTPVTTLAELWRRLRLLLSRDRYAAELEEEMRLHLELREARLREQGASSAAARFGARRRFGNRANLQQRSRDMWGLDWLDTIGADVRFAVRRLRRRPGFAFSAIAVAALGIGASTAVFSAIDAALIRPLPFARPQELVTLPHLTLPFDMSQFKPLGNGKSAAPAPQKSFDFSDAAQMHDVFSGVAAYASGGLNFEDAERPQRVQVGVVTPNFFATLGAGARAGRVFTSDEGRPNGPNVAVLSHAFWRTRLGGADVVGRSITLSGAHYQIVGIAAPSFNFPNESDLWIPLSVPATLTTFAAFRGFLPTTVVARLGPAMTVAAASARMRDRWTQVAVRPGGKMRPNYAQMMDDMQRRGAAIPLRVALVGNRREALMILAGATALLLLIACANVAGLLLSDAASRRREVALREVLGATPLRIVRQLLAESLVLSAAGTAVGIALAPLALQLLRAMMPANLLGVAPAELDLRVLAFAATLAVATGLAFGLWPALGAARTDAGETVKAGGGLGATAGGMGSARRAIITLEIALTVVLLVGSGLMLRSLQRVMSRVVGMDPSHVGVAELSVSPQTHAAERVARVQAIIDRLEVDPDIQGAAAVNDVPLRQGGGISVKIDIDGAPPPVSYDLAAMARYLMATGGYFKTLGVPLLRGRTFLPSDDSIAPRVAVINEAGARRWWPKLDPVGRTFHMGPTEFTVVGLVGDLHENRLEDSVAAQMYLPIAQLPLLNLAILARGTLPPSVLLARIVDAVHAVDRSQAVYNVRMMEDVISASETPRRTNTILVALFGAVALLLSAFGVYAVVSFGVARRAREFGIRAALGATSGDIAALVGREMAILVAMGLALGLGGAWMVMRVMASLLYGVTAHDAMTFAAVPLVLAIPAALAAALPTWRATRVNPADVMRAE